jgi:hypothetical protein
MQTSLCKISRHKLRCHISGVSGLESTKVRRRRRGHWIRARTPSAAFSGRACPAPHFSPATWRLSRSRASGTRLILLIPTRIHAAARFFWRTRQEDERREIIEITDAIFAGAADFRNRRRIQRALINLFAPSRRFSIKARKCFLIIPRGGNSNQNNCYLESYFGLLITIYVRESWLFKMQNAKSKSIKTNCFGQHVLIVRTLWFPTVLVKF